jgi:galactokinase
VVSENDRVRRFVSALEAGDLATAGEVMVESHHSLARDYEVSTDEMDAAVAEMSSVPGVYGARMTGGGFGGCVVALCDPEARVDGWVVKPVAGAALLTK